MTPTKARPTASITESNVKKEIKHLNYRNRERTNLTAITAIKT